MKRFWFITFALLLCACSRSGFSDFERLIIEKSDSVMYVTTIWDRADSAILRSPSVAFTRAELKDPLFRTLVAKMNATVQSPKEDGVGIAAPQVGINRRLVVLQRVDKPGRPFEAYPNIQIDSLFGDIVRGPEGCLSVAPCRGVVPRYTDIIVSYTDIQTLKPRRDTVRGFAAVIFQHECDHLDGVLYIDKADTVFVNSAWEEERSAYDYSKPDWMVRINYPLPVHPDTLRVLAIGNSFSDDGTQFLPDLLDSAGIHNVILGRLYIGGCSLKHHVECYEGDLHDYRYDKSVANKWENVSRHASMLDALGSEPWDVITIQQASGLSGQYDSYVPWIDSLLGIIRRHCPNPHATIAWHQTWSYSRTSNHRDFPRYGSDQKVMDEAIAACVDSVRLRHGVSVFIPVGPAISRLRVEKPDAQDYTRDGFHLSFDKGRPAAARVWFDTLIKPVVL
ncbi:MAG: DUF4886 domain-containing protein [Bacteroidales bacterium]|nr:DUF4886 domain-containing protein [Bacteroidales bacterium]